MKEEVETRLVWYKPADRTVVFYAPSWVAVMFLQFGYIDDVGPREWNKHKLTVLSGVNFWDALAKVRFVLDNLATGTTAPHRDETVLQHSDGHEVWVQCVACKNVQPLYSDMDGELNREEQPKTPIHKYHVHLLSGLNREEQPKTPIHEYHVQLNVDTGPFKAALEEARASLNELKKEQGGCEARYELDSAKPYPWGFGFFAGPKTVEFASLFGRVENRRFSPDRHAIFFDGFERGEDYSAIVHRALASYNRKVRGD